MRASSRVIAYLTACGLLAACGSIELPTKRIEYKSAGRLPSLEVPPDLTRPSQDDRFVVPDVGGRGAATYSAYQRDRDGRPELGTTAVLPNVDGARVERAGTQRWLVVKGNPEQLWPIVKDFWQETGFLVNLEIPEAGVMETDWAENRAKIPDGFIRNTLGKLLDSVYSTSERDKFRTRLERGPQDTTEVYISHRGMEEVVAGRSSQNEYTKWQPRPPSPELEAEMLRRLMVRFGVQEDRAKQQVAVAAEPSRAVLKRGEGTLALNEQFDRAWRRVGLALDRVGFTVEDRDRSKGLFFVRYIDPEVDLTKTTQGKEGFLDKLAFWRPTPKSAQPQYRIHVSDAGASMSQVQVQGSQGTLENSSTGKKILTLLFDQLK